MASKNSPNIRFDGEETKANIKISLWKLDGLQGQPYFEIQEKYSCILWTKQTFTQSGYQWIK